MTLCLAHFGVPARCFIDLWSDWAVCVSRWLRRLPLSPDSLSGRVPLFYHSQNPALDQEELGLQKQGSQAHINKPSNPVLFHHSWGFGLKGKAVQACGDKQQLLLLRNTPSRKERSSQVSPTRQELHTMRPNRSHSSTAMAQWGSTNPLLASLVWGVASLPCGNTPEVDHLPSSPPDLKRHRSRPQDDQAFDRSPKALARVTGVYCLPPP